MAAGGPGGQLEARTELTGEADTSISVQRRPWRMVHKFYLMGEHKFFVGYDGSRAEPRR